jgi:hypothetical protein
VPPLAEVARQAPFPVYGLGPDWIGHRSLGGGGLSMGEVTHVALQHRPAVPDTGGDRRDGPVLVVDTCFGEQRAPDDAPYRAIVHLEPDQPDDDESPYELPGEVIARHRARWRPWIVPVDGRAQIFWFQEAGERWAAFARVGDVRVVLLASRWDLAAVRLAVVDPAAYGDSASTTSR